MVLSTPDIIHGLLVLLIGLTAGFLDSTVGSGGSVSIPFLIFTGLPPQVAIATDRLGTAGETAGALLKFKNSKKILWRYVIPFTVIALVGSTIGANILLHIDTKILQRIVAIVVLVLLPISYFKKNIGVKHVQVSSLRKGFGFVVYFLLMIFNGFSGMGAGSVSFYNSVFLLGFTFIESNATNLIPWFLLSLSSLYIFIRGGIVDWKSGIFLVIGMTIGGYIGAHTALKKGESWIKKFFVIVVIASCIKLLFF